jgi:hypothetical protein
MPSLRQIRLATGLIVYVYVTLHFVNHRSATFRLTQWREASPSRS